MTRLNLKKYSGVRGYTLVEISVVMIILGVAAAVSYPALVSSYNRSRLNSTCLHIISALKMARGLSVTASGNLIYGVVFKPDGEYRIYSFKSDTVISTANYTDTAVANPYDIKYDLDTSVAIANFEPAPVPFFVIFRDDGVPTADGVNMPIPDSSALIKLVSTAVKDEMIIKISKSSGIAEVK